MYVKTIEESARNLDVLLLTPVLKFLIGTMHVVELAPPLGFSYILYTIYRASI